MTQNKLGKDSLSSDWWSVKNLKKMESKSLGVEDLDELEAYGDFGSYRRVLLGDDIKRSMLASHNSLESRYTVLYCHRLLKVSVDNISSILDVGCGMGYTANELTKLYTNAKVVAVDISSDAIKYGQKNFPRVDFVCQAVDPEGSTIGDFDFIYAIEFYPFTRTGDLNVHVKYVRYLLSQLNAGGSLVIQLLWGQSESVFSTLSVLEKEFPDFKFELHTVPSEKIMKIFKVDSLSFLVDSLARLILKRKPKKAIIISKIINS